jgi:hypothetical protein
LNCGTELRLLLEQDSFVEEEDAGERLGSGEAYVVSSVLFYGLLEVLGCLVELLVLDERDGVVVVELCLYRDLRVRLEDLDDLVVD